MMIGSHEEPFSTKSSYMTNLSSLFFEFIATFLSRTIFQAKTNSYKKSRRIRHNKFVVFVGGINIISIRIVDFHKKCRYTMVATDIITRTYSLIVVITD